MKDNLEDVNENIEEDNTEKNNDEKVSVETEIKGEVKETKKQNKSQIYKEDNFQTFKIILVVFLVIVWLALGYFIYSKLSKISREKIANEMMSEFVNTSQVSQEETNSLAALEEPITEASQELIEEKPIVQEDNVK